MNLSELTFSLVSRGFPKSDFGENGVSVVPPDGRYWFLLPAADSCDGLAHPCISDSSGDTVCLDLAADDQGTITGVSTYATSDGEPIASLNSVGQQSLDQLLADRTAIALAHGRYREALADHGGMASPWQIEPLLPAGWCLDHEFVEEQL